MDRACQGSNPPLFEALKSASQSSATGRDEDVRGVLPLVRALNDEDWSVLSEAAQALGNIGGPGAVTALSAALKDSDSDVRRSAAKALNKLGDARAVLLANAEEERWRRGGRDGVWRPEESQEGLWTLLKGLLTYVARG
jgi:HEAT repeat protein